jgi:hypothetical protein
MTNDQYLGWVGDEVAVCVTVILGATPEVASAVVGSSDSVELPTLECAAEWVAHRDEYNRFWFATGEIGEFTFVWEDNGWRGSERDLAKTLSSSGAFASMYWNVNALMSFTYARAGEVVAQFEPLWSPDVEVWQTLLDAGATRISDAEWNGAPRESGLILQSQVLGARSIAHPSWLRAPGVRFWGDSF